MGRITIEQLPCPNCDVVPLFNVLFFGDCRLPTLVHSATGFRSADLGRIRRCQAERLAKLAYRARNHIVEGKAEDAD